MDFLRAVKDCLICNAATDRNESFDEEKSTVSFKEKGPRTAQEVAADFVQILLKAEKNGRNLERTLRDTVSEYGWTENIGKAILSALETALREGTAMGLVMQEASEKAMHEAKEFAHDHPMFCTLLALGVLALLAPWVLEAIGFGLEGPIEGTFAAWWQSTYAGFVPKGSLFSFFQSLGMTLWRWKL